MCGIWGFSGREPDIEYLRRIAVLSARRGPHAWGVAWTGGGPLEALRELRPLPESSWDFRALTKAVAVVGHARLATSGSADSLDDTQPMVRGDVAVAHNGNVYGYRGIAEKMGLSLHTGCDSELLAAIVRGDPSDGVECAIGAIGATPYALAVLEGELNPKVSIARRKHPLYIETRAEGVYFGQVPWGGAELWRENEVRVYRRGAMIASLPVTPRTP